ncbi:bifunctional diguanylate cyclase/phosphodiesterase [Marinobacterium sediminicola]|uniref:Diguanylate cyclase (GGDEF) domain-containing protein n=1 Tax=Marinobacterium sediminicola TaxID=518898 RepID=A0ABY1RZ29_9GAMM|nr:GGDEF and EAL domain-containing protein [Marinobacterium sediminicola]ULG68088.1 EAL domain-containing protein [Marinobacterium sediminicola]SMR73400.1 diguanylate cyclase (GGDEF) domain-containing protein [Marinobacterium sediminicola]
MITPKRKYLDFIAQNTILINILLITLLSWASFWVYTYITVDTTKQSVNAQFQQRILDRFDSALISMDRRTAEIEHKASVLARQLSNRLTSMSTRQQLLEQTLAMAPDLIGAGLYSAETKHSPLLTLRPQGNQTDANAAPEWLQQLPESFKVNPTADTVWWSPVHRMSGSQEPVITLVRPILSEQGVLQGLLGLDWQVASILELARDAEATPGTLVWLTDSRNLQLAPPYQDHRRERVHTVMTQAQATTPQAIFVSDFEYQPLNLPEHPVMLYYTRAESGLKLSVAIPLDELDAPLASLQERSSTYLIVLGGVMLLLTLFGLIRLLPSLRNMRLSDHDKLTGLPNRLRLLQDLERDSSVSLILVNMDRFREVNSLFGDECGDLILKQVALRLESFMSSDENRGGRLYRVTGDEFALSLPRRRPELVLQQLEAILNCVRQSPVFWRNHEIGLSATAGAAVPWVNSPKEHSLYIYAREALREARMKGLHCRVFDGSEPLEQEFEHNQKWAGKLRDALDEEGLVAWFQPILNNTTGRIDKYECLVRMLDTNGEVVSPGKFLGVASKLRLEGHITRVMVEKCFTRFADSPMQFSINLSYSDLQQEELTAFILQRLDETGVGPRVIFELLESDHIENYDQVRHFVDEVKKRGCRIAIDDFGTGYSNFEHLLQLKVDFIKIDGSLIRNLDKDPNSRRVARGIVGLARSMKIETVAEFVHSPAVQMEVLRLGISFSQGELIGMPAPELLISVPKELTRLSYSGRNQARSAALGI